MTTRLTNDAGASPVLAADFEHIEGHGILSARLINRDGVGLTCLDLKIPELLVMLRSELGVLAVTKADLPIVTDRGVHGNLFVADAPWAASLSVEALRQEAHDRLALAEYLEAHPPVDEQQVEALTEALIEAGLREKVVPAMVARRLVEFGYHIERAQS